MNRQRATTVANLPHDFTARMPGPFETSCRVCGELEDEPRHLAWKQTQEATRQQAQGPAITRQMGT